jgi:MFS family permease
MLLFGVYGGVVADRYDKRRILYCTQSAAGLLALTVGILVTVYGAHDVPLAAIYVMSLGLGFVNLFDVPARQAFVQEMVGKDLIANAVSLNSVLMNAGRIVGPAFAGLLILIGIATCFYVNAASFLAVIIALSMMRSDELTRIRRIHRDKGQMRDGLRYVWRTPLLRNVLLAIAVVGTFAFNFTVTLPTLAKVTFEQTTAFGFTMEMVAMGVGAMFGGLYVAHRQRPTVALLSVLGVAFGMSLTLVAVAPSIVLAIIMMVPTGAASIAFVATANALMQLNSAESMRGRVMSLYGTAFLGTTPIGVEIVGRVIDATNPRIGILVGSLLTLLTGVALALTLRRRAVAPAPVEQVATATP